MQLGYTIIKSNLQHKPAYSCWFMLVYTSIVSLTWTLQMSTDFLMESAQEVWNTHPLISNPSFNLLRCAAVEPGAKSVAPGGSYIVIIKWYNISFSGLETELKSTERWPAEFSSLSDTSCQSACKSQVSSFINFVYYGYYGALCVSV